MISLDFMKYIVVVTKSELWEELRGQLAIQIFETSTGSYWESLERHLGLSKSDSADVCFAKCILSRTPPSRIS